MTIELQPGVVSGTIGAVSSKSEAHRLLICAAVADKPTMVQVGQISQDIQTTLRGLNAMGAEIESQNGWCYVIPINRGIKREPCVVDCGESGSTLRFLLAVAGALGSEVEFHMAERLSQRPLDPLMEQMNGHGCQAIWTGNTTLHLTGQLCPGKYKLPGNLSSQFVSGLLMALPLLSRDSYLAVEGRLESASYVTLTRRIQRMFGLKVIERTNGWSIPGAGYCSPGKAEVRGDWSNAAPWLGMGLLGGGGVTVTGLDLQSDQGDRAIVRILEQMGGMITQGKNQVTAAPGQRRPAVIHVWDVPDLVPVLAAVAAAVPGKTYIEGAARLRLKESDRLHTLTQMLTGLGADIQEMADGLVIQGKETLAGGTVDTYNDHRIAMAAAVASMACTGLVRLTNGEVVEKSYPAFWEDLRALGKVVTQLA